jgi:pSer/pThr/pTyr-binding forkhead associated (FHA) protein
MQPEANLFLQTQWIADEQIRNFTVYTVNGQMMEQWSLEVLKDLRHWPVERPIRFLFNLTHPNVSMSYFVLTGRELFNVGVTDKGRAEVLRFLQNNPERPIKLALVLSNTMLGTLSKYVPSRPNDERLSSKIFFDSESAQTWLLTTYQTAEVNTIITSQDVIDALELLQNDDPDIYGERNQLRMMVNGSLEVVEISEAHPVILGRHPEAEIDLRSYGELARNVSRFHAQISLVNGRLSIIDLNSRNGTKVSSRALEAGKPHFLRRDDVITVGGITISVVF